MLKWYWILGAVLLVALPGTLAQEEMAEGELPSPPDEMQQLDWFIGKWDVVSRYLTADGEWVEDHLTTEHTYILGGHVIFEHFGGPLFQMPFEAWSLRKFNPNTSMWEQRWVDVTPSGFADWTGSWDGEAGTFTGYANRTLNEDGTPQETAAREVFSNITDEGFAWEYQRTEDGGQTWTATWTLDYTRRTDE